MFEDQEKLFDPNILSSIAKVLGDTNDGLSGSEITTYLAQAEISDISPTETKWKRISSAICKEQLASKNDSKILEFIRICMMPSNFVGQKSKHEKLRSHLNEVLVFVGLAVEETGQLISCDKAHTLTDAEKKANELKASLVGRNCHPRVLEFCRAELIQGNYFHAVQEAVKSIYERLRELTGLSGDGGDLDKRLSGKHPMLLINCFKSKSEKSEQTGFALLVKGLYSMFRNPTAHDPKIKRDVTQHDAEDLLTMVSMIHRRLDKAKKG